VIVCVDEVNSVLLCCVVMMCVFDYDVVSLIMVGVGVGVGVGVVVLY
jgi:hypothetical protein